MARYATIIGTGMCLDDAIEKGKVKSGDLLVLVGSGVGYNYAGAALRMP